MMKKQEVRRPPFSRQVKPTDSFSYRRIASYFITPITLIAFLNNIHLVWDIHWMHAGAFGCNKFQHIQIWHSWRRRASEMHSHGAIHISSCPRMLPSEHYPSNFLCGTCCKSVRAFWAVFDTLSSSIGFLDQSGVCRLGTCRNVYRHYSKQTQRALYSFGRSLRGPQSFVRISPWSPQHTTSLRLSIHRWYRLPSFRQA